jgi:ssDNA-binding Zn-finger/Zn-ribbon topoisomerase 1
MQAIVFVFLSSFVLATAQPEGFFSGLVPKNAASLLLCSEEWDDLDNNNNATNKEEPILIISSSESSSPSPSPVGEIIDLISSCSDGDFSEQEKEPTKHEKIQRKMKLAELIEQMSNEDQPQVEPKPEPREEDAIPPSKPETNSPTAAECPTGCGGYLAERRRKKDDNPFLGCTRFPLCHYTEAAIPADDLVEHIQGEVHRFQFVSMGTKQLKDGRRVTYKRCLERKRRQCPARLHVNITTGLFFSKFRSPLPLPVTQTHTQAL